MIQSKVTIVNKLGLHARAAARFVSLASSFESAVHLVHNSTQVNGKSIMGIMMLAAGRGAELELRIDGRDEQKAATELRNLIENRFDEDE